jgi:hypothetical protein
VFAAKKGGNGGGGGGSVRATFDVRMTIGGVEVCSETVVTKVSSTSGPISLDNAMMNLEYFRSEVVDGAVCLPPIPTVDVPVLMVASDGADPLPGPMWATYSRYSRGERPVAAVRRLELVR